MSAEKLPSSRPESFPDWFEKPVSINNFQKMLFPEDTCEVLIKLSVSADELARWHKQGWVSFDILKAPNVETYQINEIVFVRDLVRSGLPDAYIKMLFDKLPKPFANDPKRIAWSFSLGWVLAVSQPDPLENVEPCLNEWLEQLAEDGKRVMLYELRDKIDELIALIDGFDVETNT